MRQSLRPILLALFLLAGCERARPVAAGVGIVSLTPAGTDLLVAMGLADRISGVSAYEANADLKKRLPNVGDYLRIDWERLAELKPAYLVVQGKKDRLPPGTAEKCQQLGITPVVLQIDRLADIEAAVRQLGDELKQHDAAIQTLAAMNQRIEALKDAKPKRVPAMIAFSDSGTQTVGRDTFINDAMTLAGGDNVIQSTGYVPIDAEKLASLQPVAVFLMMPGADAATVDRGTASLKNGLKNSPKIFPITSPDALMPGTAALNLAETMAADLRTLP